MAGEGKQLHVRLPEELYKRLKVQCVYAEKSMQDYVAELVAESLEKYVSEGNSEGKRLRPARPRIARGSIRRRE